MSVFQSFPWLNNPPLWAVCGVCLDSRVFPTCIHRELCYSELCYTDSAVPNSCSLALRTPSLQPQNFVRWTLGIPVQILVLPAGIYPTEPSPQHSWLLDYKKTNTLLWCILRVLAFLLLSVWEMNLVENCFSCWPLCRVYMMRVLWLQSLSGLPTAPIPQTLLGIFYIVWTLHPKATVLVQLKALTF